SAYGPCSGNSVCLYQNSNFGGNSLKVTLSAPICYNLSTLNNQASSVINDTFLHITYYDGSFCTGANYLNDGPSSHRTNLAKDCWTTVNPCSEVRPNDRISSF